MDMNRRNVVIARIETRSPEDLDALLGSHCGFASRIIDAFQMTGADDGTDGSETVIDILTDLIHACRRESVDFEDALRIARNHVGAES
jgi:hypothetical protein